MSVTYSRYKFVTSSTPGVFYTYFYNHARRLCLEILLYLELPRSPNGFFKVPLVYSTAKCGRRARAHNGHAKPYSAEGVRRLKFPLQAATCITDGRIQRRRSGGGERGGRPELPAVGPSGGAVAAALVLL